MVTELKEGDIFKTDIGKVVIVKIEKQDEYLAVTSLLGANNPSEYRDEYYDLISFLNEHKAELIS